MARFDDEPADGRRFSDPEGTGRVRRNPPDSTGLEAAEWRALVESGARVTVVLDSGERLSGRIRYYDRECISLGPADGGPKIFLRKSKVRYLMEG